MKIHFILVILIGLIFYASPSHATSEAQAAFQEGYVLLGGGEYYKAIERFKIVANNPSYPLLDYAYFYVAEAYLRSHNPNEAKQVYTMVLNYFKGSVLIPQTWLGLAKAHAAAGEKNTACTTLYEMISRVPNDDLIPEARYLLGNYLEDQGCYTEAARIYRNIDLLHPGSDYADKALEHLDLLGNKTAVTGYEAPAAIIYNLGVKHFKSGNYSKARKYFNRLTKSYGKSTLIDGANLMLGRICLRQSQFQAAEKYLNKVISRNQASRAEALFYLALTYGYQESPRAALSRLAELAETLPKSSWADTALYYMGQYYKDLGEPDKAVAVWEKLAANYPNSQFLADSLWSIGNYYYKQRNWQAAYDNFSSAFNLTPDKATDRLIFWAGKSGEKLNRHDQAIAAYKMTINRYDHSYYAYRAREELRKFGITLAARAIPTVPETIGRIDGASWETISHEQKYHELISLGLGDEAVEEAAYLVEKLPLSKRDKAAMAKYQAYIVKGKFIKPISFADRKIEEKMLAGSISQLDPLLWRFAYPRGYWSYVEKYAQMYGLDPALVYAVIREESRFKSQALSHSAAHGLMQIIPSTGRIIMRDLGLNYSRRKMYTPEVNIQMGVYYLANLIQRFDGNASLALAGYNGGPVRVEKWLRNYAQFDLDEFVEDIPLSETRNYVKKVMKSFYGYKRTYQNGG